jgi:ketosteroid isomerase-like protein
MTVAENLELVRRGYAAFSAGDVDTLRTIMAPDVVHTVPGTSAIAGAHKGIDAVLALYANLYELSKSTMRVDLEHVVSDGGDQVIAIHTSSAEREGKSMTSREALLFTIRDGRVIEIQDFFDDIDAQDRFWA